MARTKRTSRPERHRCVERSAGAGPLTSFDKWAELPPSRWCLDRVPNLRQSGNAGRSGPLNPRVDADDVVVHNPPADPILMSADEADLSSIRMLEAAAAAPSAACAWAPRS